MKDRMKDGWLNFLLQTKLKRVDVRLADISQMADGSMSVQLEAEYKWFWQRRTVSGCGPDCCQ